MRQVLLAFLHFYSKVISPILFGLGARCRFHPTCSEYAKAAVETYGTLHACRLIAVRFLKCGPWHEGGVDEIPETRVERTACNA